MSSRRQRIIPTTEQTFGADDYLGVSKASARQDHSHGTPANPVVAHVAEADPHTQYQRESEKGSANGYASLDAGGTVPDAQIPAGITRDAEADAAYAPIAKGVTNGDGHNHDGGDGGTIDHVTLSSKGSNTHMQIDTHLAATDNPHATTLQQAAAAGGTITADVTFEGRAILPMGEISYFSMTGTAVVIAAQSDGSTNMVMASPTTTLNVDTGFDNGGANNGRLRYIGTTTKMFHVACTITIAPAAANDTFVFGIAKNGTVIAASKVLLQAINASAMRSTAMHVMAELATNDYLELYVGNTTDADDCTVHSLNLFAMGM